MCSHLPLSLLYFRVCADGIFSHPELLPPLSNSFLVAIYLTLHRPISHIHSTTHSRVSINVFAFVFVFVYVYLFCVSFKRYFFRFKIAREFDGWEYYRIKAKKNRERKQTKIKNKIINQLHHRC